uniref:Potassium/proton antiporter CemA n=1 Tax=Cecarria obtusifolia TaxID=364664 RepID=A0A8K1HLC2_9MAGN|nr:chloroplast envelope membrane protein [Cecarria obtusifolia]UBN07818.1 chloroplast envelope membrane protein [Cecarria obtusifolia]
MSKNKVFSHILSLISLIFLPLWIFISFNKSMESWSINWWNKRQSETLLNNIQENSILEKFIELERLLLLDEMINEYPETHIQKLKIHKETVQLINMYNQNHMNTIFHLSINIISFIILSAYSILGNEELVILNSRVQEFLYNLNDTIKAFSVLLITDLCIGFHSTQGWELIIDSIYKDFGFYHNDQIISVLASTFPVILDTIFKYGIFHYLNRISPSLVLIYHSMTE